MQAADAWNVDNAAIWIEQAPGENRAIALRHPTYPYEADASAVDSGTLIGIAAAYLRKVREKFRLPELFEPNTAKFNVPLAWLHVHEPVHEDDDTPAPPQASFWVPSSTQLVDRTLVVLAVQSAFENDAASALGSRLGIRIVAHVSPSEPLPWKVRITGASCSTGLAKALGPHDEVVRKFFDSFFGQSPFRADVRTGMQEALGLGFEKYTLWLDGLRVIESSGSRAILDVYATVSPPEDQPDTPAYAVTARLSVDPSGALRWQRVDRQPLLAHTSTMGRTTTNATTTAVSSPISRAGPVQARLFLRDPASQNGLGDLINARPNRSPKRLEKYRTMVPLPGLTLGGTGAANLRDDLGQVQVTQSTILDPTANETVAQTVFPVDPTHSRLNDFAALSGYQRSRGLWDTMRAYGLSPIQYFKFARWPLRIRYRASIRPGPGKDGKTVNAQVNFDLPQGDLIPTTPLTLRPVQVRFALADLKRSVSRREPLGLAADPRWSWHEYGHVLLLASTGALQFRFAHSAGDALAAILSDPESALATHRRMRGLTFPWVYLHRRHDRDVFLGWSWSGRYHRPAQFSTDVNNYPRKGYRSEQILSTSLFRLYRALGGDTVRADGKPAPDRRKAAADYTAYLIMKAIGLMSPAFMLPLETPDQFVSTLIDADHDTPLPVALGPLKDRVGGCAHKVVRWAFEAQGLYATMDPLAVVDKPGKPPARDVFIDDERPDSEGDYPRGGYMPVSLEWHAAPNPSPWHASDNAIRVTGNPVIGNQVSVEVRNRGQLAANQVTVQIWWIHWQPGQPVPPWDKGTWNSRPPSAAQTVPAWLNPPVLNPPVTFGPFTLPPQPSGRRLIVAEATCAGDRANTDVSTGLPCATQPTPIIDLIAGDNNLGLRLHVVP